MVAAQRAPPPTPLCWWTTPMPASSPPIPAGARAGHRHLSPRRVRGNVWLECAMTATRALWADPHRASTPRRRRRCPREDRVDGDAPQPSSAFPSPPDVNVSVAQNAPAAILNCQRRRWRMPPGGSIAVLSIYIVKRGAARPRNISSSPPISGARFTSVGRLRVRLSGRDSLQSQGPTLAKLETTMPRQHRFMSAARANRFCLASS